MQLQRYTTLSLFFLAITVCHIVFAEMLPPSDDPDAPPPPTWVPIPANHTPAAPSKLVTTGSVERIQSGVLDLATGEYTVTFSSKTNESCAHIGSCVQCITNSCGVEPCPGNTSCHVDRYVPDPVNQSYFYMRLVTLPQGKDSYVYVKAPGVFQAYSDACVIGSGYNYVSALFQRPNSRSTSKVTYAVRNIVGPRNTNGKYHTWSFAEGGYIAVYAYDADIYQSFCLHSLLLISTPLKNGNFYYDTAAFDAALTLWSSHSATC